jgi:hypothetical protein
MLTVESQDIPSSDFVDQGGEDDWDTMGGATERSLSPVPTAKEVVPESAQQETSTGESPASTEEGRPVVARVEEEVSVETGLLDIASIHGAPTVTVVRSNL